MALMQIAEIIRGLLAGDPLQNAFCHFNQCDLQAAFCRHGSGFEANIPAANNQHMAAALKRWTHGINICQPAHRKNIFQSAANCLGQQARR